MEQPGESGELEHHQPRQGQWTRVTKREERRRGERWTRIQDAACAGHCALGALSISELTRSTPVDTSAHQSFIILNNITVFFMVLLSLDISQIKRNSSDVIVARRTCGSGEMFKVRNNGTSVSAIFTCELHRLGRWEIV